MILKYRYRIKIEILISNHHYFRSLLTGSRDG